ncbi:hypothetical protein RHGRI_000969 [Rhododendron griersonianum]|uniref:Uncharacterized protein n=1 Tax=Rhododendron griersonianum TaxID=479676 RepID=A0AAV6LLD6_9ERIC|nr:hypothetical protein RHGRI_000969 [Rhododendron griersonianum]
MASATKKRQQNQPNRETKTGNATMEAREPQLPLHLLLPRSDRFDSNSDSTAPGRHGRVTPPGRLTVYAGPERRRFVIGHPVPQPPRLSRPRRSSGSRPTAALSCHVRPSSSREWWSF